MVMETHFSLITVICKAKHMFHRTEAHLQARLAYTTAMFNVCVALWHKLNPLAEPFKISIKDFSL
jgi:hypothetical protein